MDSLKTSIKVIFILAVFVCSCKINERYSDQVATAESFIEALRNSDTVKVMNFWREP